MIRHGHVLNAVVVHHLQWIALMCGASCILNGVCSGVRYIRHTRHRRTHTQVLLISNADDSHDIIARRWQMAMVLVVAATVMMVVVVLMVPRPTNTQMT